VNGPFEAIRRLVLLLPRLARMLAGLLTDSAVPRAAKITLAAVALYVASPLDLIPDFIPIVGYLDDALLVAVVVDGLLNVLDRSLVLKYWPGDPASLDATAAVAKRLAGWVPSRVKRKIWTPTTKS